MGKCKAIYKETKQPMLFCVCVCVYASNYSVVGWLRGTYPAYDVRVCIRVGVVETNSASASLDATVVYGVYICVTHRKNLLNSSANICVIDKDYNIDLRYRTCHMITFVQTTIAA